ILDCIKELAKLIVYAALGVGGVHLKNKRDVKNVEEGKAERRKRRETPPPTECALANGKLPPGVEEHYAEVRSQLDGLARTQAANVRGMKAAANGLVDLKDTVSGLRKITVLTARQVGLKLGVGMTDWWWNRIERKLDRLTDLVTRGQEETEMTLADLENEVA